MAKKKKAKKPTAKKSAPKKAAGLPAPTIEPEEFNPATFMQRLQQEKEEREKKSKAALKEIAETLFLMGVKHAYVNYNGEGDSGDISYIGYDKINKEPVPPELDEKLKDAAWALLPSGFENNDGGYGEITLDCVNKKVHMEHNERIVEIDTTEKDIEL